jgi:hypothetical protein
VAPTVPYRKASAWTVHGLWNTTFCWSPWSKVKRNMVHRGCCNVGTSGPNWSLPGGKFNVNPTERCHVRRRLLLLGSAYPSFILPWPWGRRACEHVHMILDPQTWRGHFKLYRRHSGSPGYSESSIRASFPNVQHNPSVSCTHRT